jgi:hypothetical protein
MTARYYDADQSTKFNKSYNASASSFVKADTGMTVECDQVSIKQLESSLQVSFKCGEFDIFFTFTPTSNGFNFPTNGKNVSLGGEEGILAKKVFNTTKGTGSVQASFYPKGTVSGHFTRNGTQAEPFTGDGLFIYSLFLAYLTRTFSSTNPSSECRPVEFP